jgi:hypothetical protein
MDRYDRISCEKCGMFHIKEISCEEFMEQFNKAVDEFVSGEDISREDAVKLLLTCQNDNPLREEK